LTGDGGADDGENAGTDDSADTQRREAQPSKGFFLSDFGFFTVREQLVDALTMEEC
jgi:hypothetical protein